MVSPVQFQQAGRKIASLLTRPPAIVRPDPFRRVWEEQGRVDPPTARAFLMAGCPDECVWSDPHSPFHNRLNAARFYASLHRAISIEDNPDGVFFKRVSEKNIPALAVANTRLKEALDASGHFKEQKEWFHEFFTANDMNAFVRDEIPGYRGLVDVLDAAVVDPAAVDRDDGEFVISRMCAEFTEWGGWDVPEVIFSNKSALQGWYYATGKGTIGILRSGDLFAQLGTGLHEAQHHHQVNAVRQAPQLAAEGELNDDDHIYVAVMQANILGYIHPDDDIVRYRGQPVEVDANHIIELLDDEVMQARFRLVLTQRFPAHSLTRS